MNSFRVIKQIGEGAYGEVFEAVERSTGEVVAIKKFKDNKDDQLAQREMQTAIMVCSPNIVQCYDSFRHGNLFHLVFEYVKGSNLLELLSKHPDGLERQLVRKLMWELCSAVYVCHNSKIIHRDIKPENCLVSQSNQLKLCDFGCATVMPQECSSYEYVATRWYRPPEFELRSTNFTLAADIWSIGCVFGEMADGYPVFPGETSADQLHLVQQMLGPLGKVKGATKEFRGQAASRCDYTKDRTASLAQKYKHKLDPNGLDLIERMLQLDPEARFSAKECLEHPYFNGMETQSYDDDGESWLQL